MPCPPKYTSRRHGVGGRAVRQRPAQRPPERRQQRRLVGPAGRGIAEHDEHQHRHADAEHAQQHLEGHGDRGGAEHDQRAEPPQREQVPGQRAQQLVDDQRAEQPGQDRVRHHRQQPDHSPTRRRRPRAAGDAEQRGHEVAADDPADDEVEARSGHDRRRTAAARCRWSSTVRRWAASTCAATCSTAVATDVPPPEATSSWSRAPRPRTRAALEVPSPSSWPRAGHAVDGVRVQRRPGQPVQPADQLRRHLGRGHDRDRDPVRLRGVEGADVAEDETELQQQDAGHERDGTRRDGVPQLGGEPLAHRRLLGSGVLRLVQRALVLAGPGVGHRRS